MPLAALTSPKALSRFARQLVLANGLVYLLLGLTATFAVTSSRGVYTARAMAAAENLARVLSLSIGSEIKQIDNALASTANLARRQSAAGVPLNAAEAVRIAAEQRALIPQVDALRLTDREGRVLNDEGKDADMPQVSLADRDYFKAAREWPGQLVVSEPLQGRILKKWGVMLARARTNAAGEFDGIAYSGLTHDHFLRLFGDVQIGAQGAVSLRSAQLKMIARHAPGATVSTADLVGATASPELRKALAANAEQGAYITKSTVDGIERVSAYRRVPGYRLLVIVGIGTQEAYAPWRTHAAQLAALCGLLALLIAGLSLMIYRQQRRQVQTVLQLARLSGEQQALLDNDLVAMAKFKHRVVAWHNKALGTLFGYGPGEMKGKPSRMFYVNDSDYQAVGRAYARLAQGEQFRIQLQMQRSDGRAIWIDLSGVQISEDESLWMMVDITAVKQSESEARHVAMHDGLTGLRNRNQLPHTLADALAQAKAQCSSLAVCFIDLDGFKAVNDQHGHDAGDALLREAARRMGECVRGHDVLLRLGGDEFVVVLCDLSGREQIEPVLQRLLAALGRPFPVSPGVQAQISASVGVTVYPQDGDSTELLMSRADQAMYQAKRLGKNRLAFYSA